MISFRSNARANLLALASVLSQWNTDRMSNKKHLGQSQHLSIDDVNELKELIRTSIQKASKKYPEVIYDQLLFLTVGAIQIESQTGTKKAWELVNQSIHTHLITQHERRFLSTGLFVTAIVFSFTAMTLQHHKIKKVDDDSRLISSEVIANKTDQVTINMLLLAYNKMKNGTCQLPQAAMLPQEQREAFLKFVNKGVVEVQHVENLRLALNYVSCLYPQELMHPVVPSSHKE